MAEPLFPLGRTVITPGALEAFTKTGEEPLTYLCRHESGDWGDLDLHDKAENERGLHQGYRLFSTYRLKDSTKIYVITEHDRSVTTILLPEEY